MNHQCTMKEEMVKEDMVVNEGDRTTEVEGAIEDEEGFISLPIGKRFIQP